MASDYSNQLTLQKGKASHKLNEIGDQWRTPEDLYQGINALYGPFVLDLFTDGDNAKCEAYYTIDDNALLHDWSECLKDLDGAAFANPPYSRPHKYDGQYITGMNHIIAHTLKMREKGGRYVFLIKAATSETWWPKQADHIAFICGRVAFDAPKWFNPADKNQIPSGAFFPAAIAVFDKNWTGDRVSYVSRDELIRIGQSFLCEVTDGD